MIELYNDNNIKVYVDSDEYEKVLISHDTVLKITNLTTLDIYLFKRDINNCTVVIKGNTVTINGTSNSSKMALQVNLSNYNVTLKGNLTSRVYNGDEGHSVYTLYDETYVYQITDKPKINDKVDYILKDKSTIQTDGFESYITAYLYDSSFCWLYKGEAKIYAYDNSKVRATTLATKLEVDAYDNAKVEVSGGADVVINDESKLVKV